MDEAGERMRRTEQSWEKARGVIREIRQMLRERKAAAQCRETEHSSGLAAEASASSPPRQQRADGDVAEGPSPSRPSSPGSQSRGKVSFRFSPSIRFQSQCSSDLLQVPEDEGGGCREAEAEAKADPSSASTSSPAPGRREAAAGGDLRWAAVEELSSGARAWAPTADSDEFGLRRRTVESQRERTDSCVSQRRGSRRSITTRRTSLRTTLGDAKDFEHALGVLRADYDDSDGSDNGIDVDELPVIVGLPKRRVGLSAEAHGGWNQRRANYNPPVEKKSREQKAQIISGLKHCPFFCSLEDTTLGRIADCMIVEVVQADQCIVQQGDVGRSGYLLLDGTCAVYDDTEKLLAMQNGGSSGSIPAKGQFVRTMPNHRFFGEMTMLWGLRRTMSVYAMSECVLAKLKRDSYTKLVTQEEMLARTQREEMLRRVELFETLSDEHISGIADALEKRTFQANEDIIRQGEPGKEFYVVVSGECKATITTGTVSEKADIQEHRRYHQGDFFGERALLQKTTRAATITAVTPVEVLCLKRSRFERMLGPLEMLHQKNYLCDPRKSIADFYRVGDIRGPLGSLSGAPDPEHKTSWFAVYRPTSRDAIAKLLSGKAVGKGLNVKGKSAKKNRMSGFVPFLQISKEEHKYKIEESDYEARLTVYYPTNASFELALRTLQEVEGAAELLRPVDRYRPDVYGLEMPEYILRKAYIMDQNITFLSGWETGRQSEPAFMDMNLHAVCGDSEPEVVLYQMDSENPMNPHALLIAYAEHTVKPVVSDFDTFTVGSRGMQYSTLPLDQQDLAVWSLDNTARILKAQSSASWNSRWLEVLKEANEKGFHPSLPKYGFGDKTSYRLIEAVVEATGDSGAVRHGAECFNFTFPQELDDDYLVVWEGWPDKPWAYMDEEDLRGFLLERAEEGYSFPLNPVWPVRDEGWYEVYSALWENQSTRGPQESWYPEGSGIRERIEALHKEYPDGFVKNFDEELAGLGSPSSRISMTGDLDSCERVDLALKTAKLSGWSKARRTVLRATRIVTRLRSSADAARPAADS